MKLSYAMVFVSDMARSVRFYRDVVGATLKFESPEWTEFSTGEATLALHRGDAAAHPDAVGPTAAGQCRPGFAVEDLDSFHSTMVENGVEIHQAPRDVFGSRVAQYRDPDGVIFSVGETRRGG
jgi:predicted enzyme related to lactoylglutathione lyase